MNPPKIYIATPSHDHKFYASFVFSLLRLQAAKLFSLYISKVGGAGVARARNNQAAEFLTETDCDGFFCVDSDIGFEPEHFAKLVNSGLVNIAGPYALKQEELAWCVNGLPNEAPNPETGIQRVAKTGTGFKYIKRSVFEDHRAAHPEIAYIDDLGDSKGKLRWDFFSMGVVGPGSPMARLAEIKKLFADPTIPADEIPHLVKEILEREHGPGRYLTEDWYFDHRCEGLKIPVHIDTSFHVKHEGLISFPLRQSSKIEELEQELAELKTKLVAA